MATGVFWEPVTVPLGEDVFPALLQTRCSAAWCGGTWGQQHRVA